MSHWAIGGWRRLTHRRGVVAALGLLAVTACGGTGPHPEHPEHLWQVRYDGYGRVSTYRHGGAVRLALEPRAPKSPSETHAALALWSDVLGDMSVNVSVHTGRQLRRPRPNPWEVGWLLWHYTDASHFYYVALKPNGWELGKADPSYSRSQRFLATGSTPAFPPGRWYTIRVRQVGNAMQVWVDRRPLVNFIDTERPYRSGRIGLYAEDASATFYPTLIQQASRGDSAK